MLNLEATISINHNWCVNMTVSRCVLSVVLRCNSHNIASMYKSMCDHVEDVEAALSDVKELLQTTTPLDWQVDFVKCVQDVLKADSGWKCV